MYGNLRTENVIVKLSRDMKKIEDVKFINFGYLIEIEDSDRIRIPDQIDHLPPDMSSYLLKIKRFSKQGATQDTSNNNTDVNVKFLQAAASADCFALGVMLLQIACGYPSQMELPVKFKCRTIKDTYYLSAPHFGHCIENVDDRYAGQTIKFQERLLNNIDFFIRNNKKHD